jgi:hypothetical protein
MDYAFVPNKGLDAFNRKIYETLKLRPNTTMVERASAATVEDLITFLNDDSSVSRPISNILIGSHAADRGWISIPFTSKAINGIIKAITEYSTLEFADTNSIARIKPATVATPAIIQIKGCLIGQAKPFVDKLKTVFGGQVTIHAPLFVERLVYLDKSGYVESFAHDFSITSLTPLKTRKDIISAFQARTPKFQFLDGTNVPDKMWKTWLPATTTLKTGGYTETKIKVKLVPAVKISASKEWGALEGKDEMGFTHRLETHNFGDKNWTGTLPAATDTAGKIALLKPLLAADPLYDITKTKFPLYMRWEFSNLDDFLAGFNWELTALPTKGLNATGTRFFVRILVPICEPSSTTNLRYNFYPEAGASAPAHNTVPDNDPKFYLIV